MGIRIRVWIAILALVFLSTGIYAPRAEAMKDRCDECGNSCWMSYEPGWSDCAGPSGGCLRVVVC